MTTELLTDKEAAIARLREWLHPGDTVYTVLRKRAPSGMSRVISTLGLHVDPNRPDVRISDYTYNVAKALELKIVDDGVRVHGTGMDMGFWLVYELSAVLFRDGFGCIGEGCPASDHTNGDRNYTPHVVNGTVTGMGHWHGAGGYSLKQRWL